MRELLKNRRVVFILSGLIAFIILLAFSLSSLTSEKKELHVLREKYRELVLLKGEFLSLKQMIDGVEGKRNISDVNMH